jgi:hypothetical protein
MIFHTVCDPIYFKRFYNDFLQSLTANYQDVNLSLYFVGPEDQEVVTYCQNNNVIYSSEATTLKDLKDRFPNNEEKDILGYYPLSRWFSIPNIGQNVCVCDVDLLAINKVDHELLDNLLLENDVVNITRTKPNGETGGMMLMVLSSRILSRVNEFAKSVEHGSTSIGIAEDVKVRTFIYENFKIYELNGKMLDVSKPQDTDHGEWFVFSKGGQGEDSIKKKNKIMKFIGKAMGKRDIDWCRIVMNDDTKKIVQGLDIANIDALEISGKAWKKTGFRSYTSTRYPEFDICAPLTLDSRYDLVLAEQVFEHLRHPASAIKNVFELLKPGGRFMLTIPFLLKVHGSPEDFQRWTPDGLRHFLSDAGFVDVDVRSWGNRQCVIAYMDYESLPPFDPAVHSLNNEPDITMQIWAIAKKP